MAQELVSLFTEMGVVSAIFLSLGIILCIVEIFVPGVGFWGICGSVCTGIGILFRFIDGMSLYQFFVLVFLIVSLLALCICCLIVLIKTGVMGDVGIFATGTALPKDYSDNKQMKKVIGKIGKTTTSLSLAGRVKVLGKIYDCISEDDFIDKNKFVKILRVEDNRLVVKRIWR